MAGSFADALLKAGVVTETDISKHDQAERAKVEEEKKKVEDAAKKLEEAVYKEYLDSLSKEFKLFEKLWVGEKSRKFMIHIVHAFIPWTKAGKLWASPPAEDKIKVECCFCAKAILPISVAAEIIGNTAVDHMQKRLQFEIANEHRLDTEDFKKEYAEFVNLLGKEAFGDRKLGWKSPESKCLICMPCYSEFIDWVQDKMFHGDRVMFNIINTKRKEAQKC
jgi:hypothetical protein